MKTNIKTRLVYGILGLAILGTFQNCGAPKKDALDSSQSSTGGTGGGGGGGIVATSRPTAPSQLMGSVQSANQINLTWNDNSSNETGFKIERLSAVSGPFSSGAGAFAVVTTTGDRVTSYSDLGLQANTSYSYRISATNSMGDSATTSVLTLTTSAAPSTVPTSPGSLLATPMAATIIQLTWSDLSNNESYFKVERSANNGGTFTQIAGVGANIHSYQDYNLNPSTTYIYRVRATNSVGDSGYTTNSSGTTQAAVNVNSYAYISVNVLGTNCVQCHGAGLASAGISYQTYGQASSGSGGMIGAINAGRMPPGAPLSATQINEIKAWIAAGTPNN